MAVKQGNRGGMACKEDTYRGVLMQENPLTGDWLIELGKVYGPYTGSKPAIKHIIDRYRKLEPENATVPQEANSC